MTLKTASLAAATVALLIAAYPRASQAADVTNFVQLTTFNYESWDPPAPDGTPKYSGGYKYDWGGTAPEGFVYSFSTYFDPNDWGMTNGMGKFAFDNTVYGDFMTNNAANGPGYGFGLYCGLRYTNTDGAVLTSTNRSDYIVSFDARVEGLKLDRTNVGAEFQIRFDVPDNTIQPPDTDGDGDQLMQVNKMINVNSNWAHYVYTLDQGTIANNKDESDFIAYKALVNNLHLGVNFHQPEGAFDYDGDNVLFIDNVRIDVAQRAPTPPTPPVTSVGTMINWNFDDRDTWYDYEYKWSQNNDPAYVFTSTHNSPGFGTGGSNAWVLQFDTTSFGTTKPGWAGGGTGGHGEENMSLFNTTNLALYRVSFDARAEGLSETKTSTAGQLQYRFRTNEVTFLSLNFDFVVRSNWQTYTFTLDKGGIGSGSVAAFIANLGSIADVQPQFQISGTAGDFGYDNDNTVAIDNVKTERLEVGCPPIVQSGNTLTWAQPNTGTAKLQKATNAAGPYADVVGATSPYTVPTSGTPAFFRTIWVPPAQ